MMRITVFLLFITVAFADNDELPPDGQRQFLHALSLSGERKYTESLHELSAVIQSYPAFTQAWERYVAISRDARTLDSAKAYIKNIQYLHLINSVYASGILERCCHNDIGAITYLRACIATDPKFLPAYVELADCYLNNNTLSINNLHAYYDSLSKRYPKNAAPLVGLYEITLTNQSEHFGYSYIKKAYAIDSAYVIYSEYLYACIFEDFYSTKHYENIITSLQKLVTSTPEYEVSLRIRIHCALGLVLQVFHIQHENQNTLQAYENEYNKAYSLAEFYGVRELMPLCLIALSKINNEIGDYKKAVDQELLGARIAHETNQINDEANARKHATESLAQLGNYRDAIAQAKQAAELWTSERKSLACDDYCRVATLYQELQDYPKSLDFINRALATANPSRDILSYPKLLQIKGEILNALGDAKSAIATFHEGLHVIGSNPYMNYNKGMLLLDIANSMSALGKSDDAERMFKQAEILLHKFTDSKSDYYLALARFHKKYHRYQACKKAYQELLGNSGGYQWDINSEQLVTTFEEKGNVHGLLDETDDALQCYNKGIRVIEKLRTSVINEYQAAEILSHHIGLYMNNSYLQASHGLTKEAFELSERARARTLQDRLFIATMKFSRSVPDSIRFALFSLDQCYQDLTMRLSHLQPAELSSSAGQTLRDSIDLIDMHRSNLYDKIHLLVPQTANYFETLPLDLIKKLLSPDDAIVSYISSYYGYGAFVVTATGNIFVPLKTTRDSVQKLLNAVSPYFIGQTSRDLIARFKSTMNIEDGYKLYRSLFQPLMHYLTNVKHLIIIPDDILYYVPFEALPLSLQNSQNVHDYEHVDFLLYHYTFQYIPAAGMLGWKFENRAFTDRHVLAIGDPVFNNIRGITPTPRPKEFISNTRQAFLDSSLVSLPFTKQEVQSINELIPGTQCLTGTDATVERFKEEAPRYQVIHIATHYFIDDEQPLFSRLAFSATNSTQVASFFQTFELYSMHLGAELAVLSACNTGIGALQRGEGLQGISQAFMTAGTPSVIVSLWNVDDRSTALLMEHFYQELLQGKTKAEALRDAKRALIRDGYTDPIYWAGFILSGKNDSLHFIPSPFPSWITTFLLFLTLLFLYLLIHHKKNRKETL